MHAQSAAQKQEYVDRQAAAARNRAAAEDRGPPVVVAVPAGGNARPQPRRQWQDVEPAEGRVAAEGGQRIGGAAAGGRGIELSPEQRRAAWDEMQVSGWNTGKERLTTSGGLPGTGGEQRYLRPPGVSGGKGGHPRCWVLLSAYGRARVRTFTVVTSRWCWMRTAGRVALDGAG